MMSNEIQHLKKKKYNRKNYYLHKKKDRDYYNSKINRDKKKEEILNAYVYDSTSTSN